MDIASLGHSLLSGPHCIHQIDALGAQQLGNFRWIEFYFYVPAAILALSLPAHRVTLESSDRTAAACSCKCSVRRTRFGLTARASDSRNAAKPAPFAADTQACVVKPSAPLISLGSSPLESILLNTKSSRISPAPIPRSTSR